MNLVIPGFRKKVSINHFRNVKFRDIKEVIRTIANFVGVVESNRKIFVCREELEPAGIYYGQWGRITIKHIYKNYMSM